MKEYFESIFKRSLGRLMICILGYFAGMGIMNCLIYNPKLAYASFLAAACLVMTTAIISFARAKDKYDKDKIHRKKSDTERLYAESHNLMKILKNHSDYPIEHIHWEIDRFHRICNEYKECWNSIDTDNIANGICARIDKLVEEYGIEL